MNFLGKILRMHYRNVHKLALNLGVRDAFETKPRRPKALDETVIELETLVLGHDTETESLDCAVDDGQLSFDDLTAIDAAGQVAPAGAVTAAIPSRTPRTLLRRLTGRIPRRFRAGKVDIAKIVPRKTASRLADSSRGAHGISSGSLTTHLSGRPRPPDRTSSPFSPSESASVYSRSMRAPTPTGTALRTRLCTAGLSRSPGATSGVDPPRTHPDPVSVSGCCGGPSSWPLPHR